MEVFTRILMLPDNRPVGVLTEEQASKYLEVAPQTLANWRNRREGPPYCKIGRRVMYRLPDLDRWVGALATDLPAA